MNRTLNEKQVLKKLRISDFRHLSKANVTSMASMLDKMDPEVAKKALEQFPKFAETMRESLSDFKQTIDEGMKQNERSLDSCYKTWDAIITACEKDLEKDELNFEERIRIIEKMRMISEMKANKDSENKRFIVKIVGMSLTAILGTAALLTTTLGGKSTNNNADE